MVQLGVTVTPPNSFVANRSMRRAFSTPRIISSDDVKNLDELTKCTARQVMPGLSSQQISIEVTQGATTHTVKALNPGSTEGSRWENLFIGDKMASKG